MMVICYGLDPKGFVGYPLRPSGTSPKSRADLGEENDGMMVTVVGWGKL
jgi:hypothetical protein